MNGFVVPLKTTTAQYITNEFLNNIHEANCKPSLTETSDAEEFGNKVFIGFLNNNELKTSSGYTIKGAKFAERKT